MLPLSTLHMEIANLSLLMTAELAAYVPSGVPGVGHVEIRGGNSYYSIEYTFARVVLRRKSRRLQPTGLRGSTCRLYLNNGAHSRPYQEGIASYSVPLQQETWSTGEHRPSTERPTSLQESDLRQKSIMSKVRRLHKRWLRVH